jgi:hypothetical protein
MDQSENSALPIDLPLDFDAFVGKNSKFVPFWIRAVVPSQLRCKIDCDQVEVDALHGLIRWIERRKVNKLSSPDEPTMLRVFCQITKNKAVDSIRGISTMEVNVKHIALIPEPCDPRSFCDPKIEISHNEFVAAILDSLDPIYSCVAELGRECFTNAAIAGRLGMAERSVERIFAELRFIVCLRIEMIDGPQHKRNKGTKEQSNKGTREQRKMDGHQNSSIYF